MKNYYRVMLGRKSSLAVECFAQNYIGIGFGTPDDLSARLTVDWRAFNREFVPRFLADHPEKSKIAAGLASGVVWTVCKGIQKGDTVLCPDGQGNYRVGEITSDYVYAAGAVLNHRRLVTWLHQTIARADMSEGLRNSTGSIGTVSQISKHSAEIERLIGGTQAPTLVSTDQTVEDPAAFALEKHLEDFLVQNWAQTDLGRE